MLLVMRLWRRRLLLLQQLLLQRCAFLLLEGRYLLAEPPLVKLYSGCKEGKRVVHG